jgi:glycogen synthase
MRIAMLGWEFPPFVSGGLGVHCFELTKALCKTGVEIDFFMPSCGAAIPPHSKRLRIIEVISSRLQPYIFTTKNGRSESYGENLLSAVSEYADACANAVIREDAHNHYDILHAHDWLTAPAGERAKKRLSVPLVQTFHSTEFDRTSFPWDCILGIERKAAADSDLIIAVSKRTKEQVLRLGAPSGKIRVVYNGVDRHRFRKILEEQKRIDEFKGGKKVVLFLGRLTEQKGPVQFLHAAKLVLEREPNALFVIAGKGELLPLLINMAMQLGISKSVRFLGFVPEDDQRKIYKIADVYVMPSTSEPFGITALEAMSSGVPVIVSKTSGVSEVVKSALRVDFWDIEGMAEKILAVLQHPPLSRTMVGMEGRDLELCTWDKAAGETMGIYREAIGKGR